MCVYFNLSSADEICFFVLFITVIFLIRLKFLKLTVLNHYNRSSDCTDFTKFVWGVNTLAFVPFASVSFVFMACRQLRSICLTTIFSVWIMKNLPPWAASFHHSPKLLFTMQIGNNLCSNNLQIALTHGFDSNDHLLTGAGKDSTYPAKRAASDYSNSVNFAPSL